MAQNPVLQYFGNTVLFSPIFQTFVYSQAVSLFRKFSISNLKYFLGNKFNSPIWTKFMSSLFTRIANRQINKSRTFLCYVNCKTMVPRNSHSRMLQLLVSSWPTTNLPLKHILLDTVTCSWLRGMISELAWLDYISNYVWVHLHIQWSSYSSVYENSIFKKISKLSRFQSV
jgi:hypothetical protein